MDDFQLNPSTGTHIYTRLKDATDETKISKAFTTYYQSLVQLYHALMAAGTIEQFIQQINGVYLPNGKKAPKWVVLIDLYDKRYDGRAKLNQWYDSGIMLPIVYEQVGKMEDEIIQAMVTEGYLQERVQNGIDRLVKNKTKTIVPPSAAQKQLPDEFIEALDDYPKAGTSKFYIATKENMIIYIHYSGRQLKVVEMFTGRTIYEDEQGNFVVSPRNDMPMMRESSHNVPLKHPDDPFWFSRFISMDGIPTVYKLEEIDTRFGEYVPDEANGTVEWIEKLDFLALETLD